MTDATAPLAIVDREMIERIIDNYARYAPNPYTLSHSKKVVTDLEGLQQSLVNYVGMVRRGEVPVEVENPCAGVGCACDKVGSGWPKKLGFGWTHVHSSDPKQEKT